MYVAFIIRPAREMRRNGLEAIFGEKLRILPRFKKKKAPLPHIKPQVEEILDPQVVLIKENHT